MMRTTRNALTYAWHYRPATPLINGPDSRHAPLVGLDRMYCMGNQEACCTVAGMRSREKAL